MVFLRVSATQVAFGRSERRQDPLQARPHFRGDRADFRPPDLIRLAPIALYTRYEDIVEVVLALAGIMERKAYLEFPNVREEVA